MNRLTAGLRACLTDHVEYARRVLVQRFDRLSKALVQSYTASPLLSSTVTFAFASYLVKYITGILAPTTGAHYC